MTSYLSNLLTDTTSKYTSIRRNILSDESDGDTEDDTHICRALRAYYQEKGRPFPPWLPPDPRGPPPVTSFSQTPQQRGYAGAPPQPRRGGGLSDLWDTPSERQAAAPPQSLRSRGAPGAPPVRGERFDSGGSSSQRLQPTGGRPLPSQRDNSHQRPVSHREEMNPGARPGLTTAPSTQDRLKARLIGGSRSNSPAMGQQGDGAGRGDPYDRRSAS